MCDFKKFFEENKARLSVLVDSLEEDGVNKFLDVGKFTFDGDPEIIDEAYYVVNGLAKCFAEMADVLCCMYEDVLDAREQD